MTETQRQIPGSEGTKKNQVRSMFDNISEKYDFLNHLLSFGIDKFWRRRAISMLKPYNPGSILDIATGTGDLSISALRLKPSKIIGIDISEGMLRIGIEKIKQKKLDNTIQLMTGDSENIQFPDNEFDSAMVAFGVRNFENLLKGLTEIRRVLKPGAPLVVLEFSKPKYFPVKQVYNFYFKNILPNVGRFFSKDKMAYNYLPDSVSKFPEGKDFLEMMDKAGFKSAKERRLTFGVASIYIAIK
jgi:demethylmenaquinone methyltransferase / 2-methoxy-6-polyprenyl-1,4-benzoquinol methylase